MKRGTVESDAGWLVIRIFDAIVLNSPIPNKSALKEVVLDGDWVLNCGFLDNFGYFPKKASVVGLFIEFDVKARISIEIIPVFARPNGVSDWL